MSIIRKRLPSMSTQASAMTPGRKRKRPKLASLLLEDEDLDKSGSMITYEGPIGLKAKLDFNKTFRHRIQLADRVNHSKLEPSPTLAYLNNVEKQRLSPKSVGIVFRKGNSSSFDMKNRQIGNKYARALSKGVARMEDVQEMNLASNRLTDEGICAMLSHTDFFKLEYLNLSNNRLGENSIEVLVKSIPGSNISQLVLDRTYISEIGLKYLCNALTFYRNLVFLGLANNKISKGSALADLAKYNNSLEKLDLHWNNLQGENAASLFKALAFNETLKELDLSWNYMGNSPVVEKSIGFFFENNDSLKHLDLSYNRFTKDECEKFAEASLNNQALLGIHMIGNHAKVDYRGAIIPTDRTTKLRKSRNFRRIFETFSFEVRREPINCWVCEKWIDYRFEWVPGVSGTWHQGPVFLHLEFNNFEPIQMSQNEDGVFYLDMAIPPRKLKFYFSSAENSMLSSEYPVKNNSDEGNSKFNYIGKPTGPECSVTRKNLKVFPRSVTKLEENLNIEKEPWDYSRSIFSEYILDTEELLASCFEADIRETKIDTLLRNEEDLRAVIETLKVNYKYIRDWYKNLAAYGTLKIPSIGFSAFKDFLKKCNLLAEQSLQNTLGVQWGAVNIPKDKGFQLNPISTLVRYEFMEMLVRVSIERNHKGSVDQSLVSVLDSIKSAMDPHRTDKWRKNSFHTEQVDLVLSAHRPILDTVYNKYAGKITRKAYMAIEEFREMIHDAQIMNDCFGIREGDVCFHQSMMTQVDELHTTRHFEMRFVEFLEAISRVADKANLNVNHKDHKHHDLGIEISLVSKLEALMPFLFRLCPKNVRESFVFPTAETLRKFMYPIIN